MESTTSTYEYTIVITLNEPKAKFSPGDWGAVVGILLISLPSSILNGLLVGTVGSSPTLQRSPFYIAVLGLSLAYLVDCTINAALSLAFAVRFPLSPVGKSGCIFAAGFHHLVAAVVSLCACHLLLDRVFAVRRTTVYKNRVSKNKQTTAILLLWIFAVLATFPVFVPESIHVRPFPNRLTCTMTRNNATDTGYIVTYGSVIYGFPFAISVLCVLYLISILFKDWRASKSSVHNLTDNILRQPLLWSELQLTRTALAVVISYFLLFLPNVINELDDAVHVSHPIKFWTKNATYNSTENITRPEVWDSPPKDNVFVWFRYLCGLFYPLIIFYLRQDIAKKAKILITFWRPHPETSPRPSAYVTRGEDKTKPAKRKRKKEAKAHYSTPVLFATSEGLYLRVTEENKRKDVRSQSGGGGGFKFWMESGGTGQWSAGSGQPQFVCHVCDIWDVFDDIEDLEEGLVSTRAYSPNRTGRSAAYQYSLAFSENGDPIQSDADSGVGGDSDEDIPPSARERVVRFADGASTSQVEDSKSIPNVITEDSKSISNMTPEVPEPGTPYRPKSMRLPPICESDAEEFKTRIYVKNGRGGTGDRYNRRKSDGHRPVWNANTRPMLVGSGTPILSWNKSKKRGNGRGLKKDYSDAYRSPP